jgi:hypothetical protein
MKKADVYLVHTFYRKKETYGITAGYNGKLISCTLNKLSSILLKSKENGDHTNYNHYVVSERTSATKVISDFSNLFSVVSRRSSNALLDFEFIEQLLNASNDDQYAFVTDEPIRLITDNKITAMRADVEESADDDDNDVVGDFSTSFSRLCSIGATSSANNTVD